MLWVYFLPAHLERNKHDKLPGCRSIVLFLHCGLHPRTPFSVCAPPRPLLSGVHKALSNAVLYPNTPSRPYIMFKFVTIGVLSRVALRERMSQICSMSSVHLHSWKSSWTLHIITFQHLERDGRWPWTFDDEYYYGDLKQMRVSQEARKHSVIEIFPVMRVPTLAWAIFLRTIQMSQLWIHMRRARDVTQL